MTSETVIVSTNEISRWDNLSRQARRPLLAARRGRTNFSALTIRTQVAVLCGSVICGFTVAAVLAINVVLSFGAPTGNLTTILAGGTTPVAGTTATVSGPLEGVTESQRADLVRGVDATTLGNVRLISVAVLAAALLLAVAGSYALAGFATRPIRTMRDDARLISSNTFGRRLHTPSAGDLTDMAAAFNDLLDRLQRSFDQQRRFAGNAAHELLTPIATMRTAIELDADMSPDAATLLHRNLARLEGVIESLLVLSQEERTGSDEAFEIRPVVEDAITTLQPLADARQVKLRLKPGDSRPVTGEYSALFTCCRNLLDNAIRYNHPGGDVACEILCDSESVTVAVADTGTGIAAADLPHIFERFYRAGRHDTAGHGLGLAIVEHIARQHGGSVTVQSEAGVGSTFRLTLPLAHTAHRR